MAAKWRQTIKSKVQKALDKIRPVITKVETPIQIDFTYWKTHFHRFPYDHSKCPVCESELKDYNYGPHSPIFDLMYNRNRKICLNCGLFEHRNMSDPKTNKINLFIRRGYGYRIVQPLYPINYEDFKVKINSVDKFNQHCLNLLTEETAALWKSGDYRSLWHKFWRKIAWHEAAKAQNIIVPYNTDPESTYSILNLMTEQDFMVFADWLDDKGFYQTVKEVRTQLTLPI